MLSTPHAIQNVDLAKVFEGQSSSFSLMVQHNERWLTVAVPVCSKKFNEL